MNEDQKDASGLTVSTGALIDKALEISAKRRETLARLKAALEAGNTCEVLKLASELCGLNHEETSHRVN